MNLGFLARSQVHETLRGTVLPHKDRTVAPGTVPLIVGRQFLGGRLNLEDTLAIAGYGQDGWFRFDVSSPCNET